ncbi:helix-turn-helix transcriptional regulator [Undibacterium seohonense]|jgi:DNA-binding XRE family transcriptional regulator|uniref:Helix-turn-helix transcriptional regulator n=1 Tax=Undibacterium seohonense TaxID=1344950 RepID=A0ABR6X701_9BURK|nr:helix-turn-helix transcriptional regulator [Undibacterium seohonense]MBC3808360.1 helix-turn-helix transcriptional regulator [Undibacterium seohonense]
MLTHAELKLRALANPEVKIAYDSLAEEYTLAHELLHAREAAGLTQAEVATRMQTKAPAIARLEGGGRHSPSILTLRKYAAAVGCQLEVRLVPKGG